MSERTTKQRNPSLFDDALSDRVNKPKKNKYIWPILFVVGGIGMAFSIFYGASEQKEELIAELEEQAEEDASTLEKKLAEMRARKEGQNSTDESSGSDEGRSASTPAVAKTEKPSSTPAGSRSSPTPKPVQQSKEAEVSTEISNKPQVEKEPSKRVELIPDSPVDTAVVLPDPFPKKETVNGIPPEEISNTEQESVIDPEPSISSDHELAYNLLLENSAVAGKLANGEYSSLDYKDNWRVVQQNKSEVWIDLIAHWTNGGDSVHFIWAVNQETNSVRPLSQAARNLESENRTP